MIRNREFYVLEHMKQQGTSTTQIANELGRDRYSSVGGKHGYSAMAAESLPIIIINRRH